MISPTNQIFSLDLSQITPPESHRLSPRNSGTTTPDSQAVGGGPQVSNLIIVESLFSVEQITPRPTVSKEHKINESNSRHISEISICERAIHATHSFAKGSFICVLRSVGVAIALAETVVSSTAVFAVGSTSSCFITGRRITAGLVKATSFNFRLVRVGLTNIIGSMCKIPVYIERHCVKREYITKIDDVTMETDGPFYKAQKSYYRCAAKCCCIFQRSQGFDLTRNSLTLKIADYNQKHSINRAISWLVGARPLRDLEICAHKVTPTEIFKIETKRKKASITQNLELSCNEVLLNFHNKACNPQRFIVLKIINLVELLTTFKYTFEEKATQKEIDVLESFAKLIASKCKTEDIVSIMKMLIDPFPSTYAAKRSRRIHNQVYIFTQAFMNDLFKNQSVDDGNYDRLKEVCKGYEILSTHYVQKLDDVKGPLDLLKSCLNKITTKEILSIVFEYIKKDSVELLEEMAKILQMNEEQVTPNKDRPIFGLRYHDLVEITGNLGLDSLSSHVNSHVIRVRAGPHESPSLSPEFKEQRESEEKLQKHLPGLSIRINSESISPLA